MPYKVIVWGTGFVGKMVIREILDHPEFELAGTVVHDLAKDGLDVGELVGSDPVGIHASTDAAAVLALEADAVAYYGPTAEFANENIANLTQALRAGKNVVDTSMTPLVYPKACPPAMVEPLARACEEGGTSILTTGIDPGFANDLFPMTLMGVCARVDSVRIQELLDYATYTGDYAPMGLGEPMEHRAILEEPAILIYAWGHTIPMIADAVGARLERIDTVWEKWAAPERIEFANGVIESGHCAAVHFEIRGWVDGEPRIVVEHVNRITNEAAPHWPRARLEDNDAYRVIIEGSPRVVQETVFRGEKDADAVAGGCLSTGMRAVNAIPAVVAAAPGVLSALDLPLVPGHGTIH